MLVLVGGLVLLGGSRYFGLWFTDTQDRIGSESWKAWHERFVASRPRWEQRWLSRAGRRRFNTFWFAAVGLTFVYIGVRGLVS